MGAVMLVSVLGAGPALAEPNKANPVASLINQIADVDQSLTDLGNAVAAKRENVNRTLVDFQNAMAAQQVAAAASKSAKGSLNEVSTKVEAAQKEFDAFVRTVYREGNNRGAMTRYVASDDPDKVLAQMSSIDRITRQQQTTIRKLQVARNQQANRVAATEATRQQTAVAAQDATIRRNDAIAAVQEAQEAVRSQQGKRNSLITQRNSLATKLNALRGKKGVDAQAPAPNTPAPGSPADVAGKVLDQIPTNPVAGDDLLAQAAAAAAKLAADTGQALLASLIGQQQIPHSKLLDELGIGGADPTNPG
ncbi:MAG: NlpC/P60 family protein, partial [Gordonia sp. (in: high G+C Gram-positive bacteria)]